MRGKKWYSFLFTFLPDAAVNNALQLYKLKNRNIEHLSFWTSTAMACLKKYGCKRSRGKARQSAIQAESRFDRTDHPYCYSSRQAVKVHSLPREDYSVRKVQRACAHEMLQELPHPHIAPLQPSVLQVGRLGK